MKRDLEKSWPALWRRICKSPPSSGLRTTIASAIQQPFLVPPKETMSTPLFQVISAGVHVERRQRIGEARAVHVQRQAVLLRHRGNGRDVVERIDGPDFGRLGDRHRHRLAGGRKIVREACDGAIERLRVDTAQRARNRRRPRAAGEEAHRAELVDGHMRLGVAEGDAADAVAGGHGQSVGRRARRDEEDRYLAFENFIEAFGDIALSSSPLP